jgi:hypothetical protein
LRNGITRNGGSSPVAIRRALLSDGEEPVLSR